MYTNKTMIRNINTFQGELMRINETQFLVISQKLKLRTYKLCNHAYKTEPYKHLLTVQEILALILLN